jgi:uncharacterized protein YbaR (Trm112 family)
MGPVRRARGRRTPRLTRRSSENVHLLLTDRLSCPRCGPTFGLILRADRLEGRTVLDGALGCPNCRDTFALVDGFADLRAPPRRDLGPGLAGVLPPGGVGGHEPGADRLVALLGVARGPGTIVLVGEPARAASRIAALVEDVQVVAVDADVRFWPEAPGVSRLASAPGLPFFGAGVRAVAIDGRVGSTWLAEAARVVVPSGRVVLVRPPDDAPELLRELGLSVLAADSETVVAARG